MTRKYRAYVKVCIPVEFIDNESLNLKDQAVDALPILPDGTELYGVLDLEEVEAVDA